METTLHTCESCRIDLVNNVEDHQTEYSYQLCAPCRKRLHDRALRPLELFNLVAIHGHTHDLHDDFYDYDTGEATQPSAEVENAQDFPFPTLQVVRDDLQKLIDFACVEYFTSDKTIELIVAFEKEKILEYLRYKVNYNRGINYKCYEIASKTLHHYAENGLENNGTNGSRGNLPFLLRHYLSAYLPKMRLPSLRWNYNNSREICLPNKAGHSVILELAKRWTG